MRSSIKLGIVLPLLLAATPNPASATILIYTGTLSGANEVPPNASTATATYTATLDDVLNSIAVTLSFSGLTGGPASAAHIHCCTTPGMNAPVVIPFGGFPSATSGTYSNTFLGISPTNVAGIEAGLAYINIHNATFPGGEIRAQLTSPIPEPASWAMMIGGFALIGAALRRHRPAALPA
ncbi:MAG: CHRD domain-containing protein [Sphingomonadales bacterium]|nr:CHRD domain-containing protein [Sphingomonadales bacterium]